MTNRGRLTGLLLFSIIFPLQINAKTLKIVSWNVYFDDVSGVKRYPRILTFLSSQKADIICLQEVTRKFYHKLNNDKHFSKYHIVSGDLKNGYTNVIVTKLPVIQLHIFLIRPGLDSNNSGTFYPNVPWFLTYKII